MNSNNETVQQRVAAHPFLNGMEAHQLAVLSQSATPAHFSAGRTIFQTGEPANGFYLIERGSVVLEAPQPGQTPVVIDVVAAGEPLGWSWLFPPYSWQFDARATEPTDALCFSGILLRQHRDEDLNVKPRAVQKNEQRDGAAFAAGTVAFGRCEEIPIRRVISFSIRHGNLHLETLPAIWAIFARRIESAARSRGV